MAGVNLKKPSNPRRDRDLEWLRRLKKEGSSSPPEPSAPAELYQALDQFNAGDFFLCHETLEALWLKEGYPTRLFYQGILKVAVGLYHRDRGNPRGARAKLREGIEMLEPFAPRFMGVEVGKLRTDAGRCLESLADGGKPPRVAFTRPSVSSPSQ